jgi:tagatose 1,6-diphosphate aldolase
MTRPADASMDPDTPLPVSAAVLTARGLTPGKYRGLQRITHAGGTMTVLALDQNASMIRMAGETMRREGQTGDPTLDAMVEAKIELARRLSPGASGLLIDGVRGAWPVIASCAVPPSIGLLVRVDQSGGPTHDSGLPLSRVEPGWSVEKIKRMGGDAVKLLLPFDPFERQAAEIQLAMLERVAADCRRHDILLLLEPLSAPRVEETATDAAYLDRKPAAVIETARLLSRHGDIYAAEFPGTLDREPDTQLEDNLDALSAATERPWVLMSSGLDFDVFLQQVEMAVEAGASGVHGGRAIWREYFQYADVAARKAFATGAARDRIARIDAVVRERATPWFDRYGLSPEDLAAIRPAEGWAERLYPGA